MRERKINLFNFRGRTDLFNGEDYVDARQSQQAADNKTEVQNTDSQSQNEPQVLIEIGDHRAISANVLDSYQQSIDTTGDYRVATVSVLYSLRSEQEVLDLTNPGTCSELVEVFQVTVSWLSPDKRTYIFYGRPCKSIDEAKADLLPKVLIMIRKELLPEMLKAKQISLKQKLRRLGS